LPISACHPFSKLYGSVFQISIEDPLAAILAAI
ncbi:MAG: hypothetical protein ACI9KM_002648, partial [Rubritalea sp.]